MKVEIGDATLYLGDCMEILPTIDKVDAVITDPPYGIGASTSNFIGTKKRKNAHAAPIDYGHMEWDNKPASNELIEKIVQSANISIIWGGNYFNLPPSSCWLIWDKVNGSTGFADCEMAWTNKTTAVRLFRHQWAGMMRDSERNIQRVHPTQKPIALMEWCIEQATDCQTIFDPFMGSGTTGVAAVQMGRKFIGIEREPKYFDIACKRIEQASKQVDMFVEPIKQVQESLL